MASYNVCSWGKVNCSGSKLKPIGRLAAFFLRTDNVSFIIWLWSKIKSGSSDIKDKKSSKRGAFLYKFNEKKYNKWVEQGFDFSL